MANGFFSRILQNILKNSLVYIFIRCLSYRLIKIHRKFTSAYLLCDKASLRTEQKPIHFSKQIMGLNVMNPIRFVLAVSHVRNSFPVDEPKNKTKLNQSEDHNRVINYEFACKEEKGLGLQSAVNDQVIPRMSGWWLSFGGRGVCWFFWRWEMSHYCTLLCRLVTLFQVFVFFFFLVVWMSLHSFFFFFCGQESVLWIVFGLRWIWWKPADEVNKVFILHSLLLLQLFIHEHKRKKEFKGVFVDVSRQLENLWCFFSCPNSSRRRWSWWHLLLATMGSLLAPPVFILTFSCVGYSAAGASPSWPSSLLPAQMRLTKAL